MVTEKAVQAAVNGNMLELNQGDDFIFLLDVSGFVESANDGSFRRPLDQTQAWTVSFPTRKGQGHAQRECKRRTTSIQTDHLCSSCDKGGFRTILRAAKLFFLTWRMNAIPNSNSANVTVFQWMSPAEPTEEGELVYSMATDDTDSVRSKPASEIDGDLGRSSDVGDTLFEPCRLCRQL